MKKIFALILALSLVLSLAACGNKGESSETAAESSITDSLELLTTVWSSYSEDEKFAACGADMSEENMSTDGPGRFGLADADNMDYMLGFPAAAIERIDDAASLMHMMNANTFTCGVYRAKDAGDVDALVTEIKDNILARQWMCGFPEKLYIATVDNYIVACFGNGELIDNFTSKLSTAYSGAVTVIDEPIE